MARKATATKSSAPNKGGTRGLGQSAKGPRNGTRTPANKGGKRLNRSAAKAATNKAGSKGSARKNNAVNKKGVTASAKGRKSKSGRDPLAPKKDEADSAPASPRSPQRTPVPETPGHHKNCEHCQRTAEAEFRHACTFHPEITKESRELAEAYNRKHGDVGVRHRYVC